MDDFLLGEDSQPTGERWDPLGAPNDNEEEERRFDKNSENECCEHYNQYVLKFKFTLFHKF